MGPNPHQPSTAPRLGHRLWPPTALDCKPCRAPRVPPACPGHFFDRGLRSNRLSPRSDLGYDPEMPRAHSGSSIGRVMLRSHDEPRVLTRQRAIVIAKIAAIVLLTVVIDWGLRWALKDSDPTIDEAAIPDFLVPIVNRIHIPFILGMLAAVFFPKNAIAAWFLQLCVFFGVVNGGIFVGTCLFFGRHITHLPIPSAVFWLTGFIFLGGLAFFLGLLPRRCPACGVRTMLVGTLGAEPPEGTCFRCATSFFRDDTTRTWLPGAPPHKVEPEKPPTARCHPPSNCRLKMGGSRAVPADYLPNYHATLLVRAAPAYFSRTALLFRIIPANIAVDLNQKNEWLHFDNGSFSAGLEHIAALWARIESGAGGMADFGRLTHTVQDFYSHSNWVELHQHLCPLPVWDMNVGSLPAEVQSGTFPSRKPSPGQTAPTHAELNKDSPFGWFSPQGCQVVADGPNRGKSFFELGYEAALAATCVQFDRLMRVVYQH